MDKDHACKECRRLGEGTSLKGIARILKSNHIVLRVLWTICTVFFVSFAMYQVFILLSDYFSYPEVTDLDERSLDLAAETSVDLPHVTVCNLNPLSTRAMKPPGGPSQLSFRTFMTGGFQVVQHFINSTTDRDILRRHLLKPRGFYGVISKEEARSAGHTQEEFIASCKLLVLQGLDLDEEDCAGVVNITLFQHSKYFNCFTIAMPEQMPNNIMTGYSLTLQLSNFHSGRSWYSVLETQRKQQLGAILAIHEPLTYPLMVEQGHIIAPGTHVNLRYSLEQRNRMPEPYGVCRTTEDYVGRLEEYASEMQGRDVKIPYKYSKSMCVSVWLEYYVIQACNCTDYTLMHMLDHADLSECGRFQAENIPEMLRQIICSQNQRKTHLQKMMSTCPDPCHQLRYIPEISESAWPPYPVSRNFYDEMIAGKPYEQHYSAVREAIEASENGTSTLTSEQRGDLEASIKENFINIDVFLGRLRKLEIRDAPKITSASLMSQLGGTLNLWAGITVVLLIELADFLLRLCVLPKDQ